MRRIAVAGAGIYGCCIAQRLAEAGCRVDLFDPRGLLGGASGTNQFRLHAGYHYPRSPETIGQVLADRDAFLAAFAEAVVRDTAHYYAVPRHGSRTTVAAYEAVMDAYGLPLSPVRPGWIDFGYIDRCYRVAEQLYDPDRLRALLDAGLRRAGVARHAARFGPDRESAYDGVVYATYGAHGDDPALRGGMSLQVAEKVRIAVPAALRRISLVVVDGAFTAFDRYGAQDLAQFGSARHTNHWQAESPEAAVPARYRARLARTGFEPCPETRFAAMRADAARATPAIAGARYLGSRYTLRLVEASATDRRTVRITERDGRVFHVLSGKVVGALRAASHLAERLAGDG